MTIENIDLGEINRQAEALDFQISRYVENIRIINEQLDTNIIPNISAEDDPELKSVVEKTKTTFSEIQVKVEAHFKNLANIMHTYYEESIKNEGQLGADIANASSGIDETIAGINNVE